VLHVSLRHDEVLRHQDCGEFDATADPSLAAEVCTEWLQLPGRHGWSAS
jgi:hypothetical protein